jgi:hypothetical protein
VIGAEDETRSIDQVEMIGHRRGLASPTRAREMRLGHMARGNASLPPFVSSEVEKRDLGAC